MSHEKLRHDIDVIADSKADTSKLIEQVRVTRRPLVLTQNGYSAAVVLDIEKYQQMLDELEILRDVRTATKEIDSGKELADTDAKAEIRKRFGW